MNKNTTEIKYLSKDFSQFRENLINLAKTYYPDTYNDFNESSPGSMFIDMSSYVGDVLALYVDQQLRESLLGYAQERKNVVALARMLGYKPNITTPAQCTLDVFQILPSIVSGSAKVPDFNYALNIVPGMVVGTTSKPTIEFRCDENINFAVSSSNNPTETLVYTLDSNNQPEYFLLKKQVKVYAATEKTINFTFGTATKFAKVLINDDNIIGISKVVDSDGNIWTEVPYLAQETIFDEVTNTYDQTPDLPIYKDSVPFLLKLKNVPKRFVTRPTADNKMEIQFGSGISTNPDEEIIPNPENVGSSLPLGVNKLDATFDPSNFVYTKAYGQVPTNTTLTVTYLVGNGIKSNVGVNTITNLLNVQFNNDVSTLNPQLYSRVVNSVAVTNNVSATGGKDTETLDEIREKALATFSAQNRTVTRDDYLIRLYSMPAKYGAIAKAHISQDEQQNPFVSGEKVRNPFALNMYCLGYDSNKNLIQLNTAIKENIKHFLSQYRILTDAINIKDAYVVNFAIHYDILVLPGFNNNEVLLQSVEVIKNYFNIDNWQINQPIIKAEIINELLKVPGIQSVPKIFIRNMYGTGYSNIFYDMETAERNHIIYPSLDPCIFELKYPNSDIKGRVIKY